MGQSTGLSKVLNQKEVFSVVSKLRAAQRIYAICEARQGHVSQSLGFSTIAKRGVPIEPKVPSPTLGGPSKFERDGRAEAAEADPRTPCNPVSLAHPSKGRGVSQRLMSPVLRVAAGVLRSMDRPRVLHRSKTTPDEPCYFVHNESISAPDKRPCPHPDLRLDAKSVLDPACNINVEAG